MNISYKNEVIWLAPERTATSITKKILEKYDFFAIKRKFNFEPVNLSDVKQSHSNEIPDEFRHFKIICNIRNPYDRVFGCYLNFFLQRAITRKETDVKTRFNNWLKKTFLNHRFEVFLGDYYSDSVNYFNKWTFENINPDFVIKSENLLGDTLKIPFIEKENTEYLTSLEKLCEENSYINKRYHHFNQLYEFENAKLIYHYFKPVFYKFNYSPFSFTEETLTEEQKVSFIHGEIK